MLTKRYPVLAGWSRRFIIETVYKKIPSTNWLGKKIDYNTKITETESKTPNVTGLVITMHPITNLPSKST